jgi:NAD(P)-dependent dehydrogenase (short-subunit alcohol dehydrogenase family)
MDLKGRVALITGGAGHIGQAFSEALAEVGASLIILDISKDVCVETAERIQNEYHVEAMPLIVDLAKEQEVLSIPQKAMERFGRLDILVNNAAFVGTSDLKGWTAPFLEQAPSTWRLALEVNLTAPFILTQACTEALRASGHGSVINISSIRGMAGVDLRMYEGTSMGSAAGYSASKGGLIQFTRYLATILAPDIRVNSISLGGVWRNQPKSFVQNYVERTPLKRMATEEDTKGAIVYLASDLSAYVTGHNLVVDGGWSAW